MAGEDLLFSPNLFSVHCFCVLGLALAGSARGGAWKLFAMNFPPGKFRWKTFDISAEI
jgi:hypothetical protein